jgi:hypothetical protein
MEKFTLTSNIIIGSDSEANVCLKPSSVVIEDYIATYKVYENEASATSGMPSFIAEQTPLLFYVFKEMTNVPIEIRDNYYL